MPSRMKNPRWNGRHYTPAALARDMVRRALAAWRATNPADSTTLPRVLDPACGDGVFLRAALAEIESGLQDGESVPSRCRIARQCLFGVDTDEVAVEAARRQIADLVNQEAAGGGDAEWLESQVLVGDALCGSGLESIDASTADEPDGARTVIDWGRSFPLARAAGGFDVIVGNPPYVRERAAKPLFDQIARSPLGKRWRSPRMDLWYYFLHRSLDLLKPRGVLSFVVPAYWTASTGAIGLIDRLQRETWFQDVLLLGNRSLFEGVQGQHLVFRLMKRLSPHDSQLSPPESSPPPPVSIRTIALTSNLESALAAATHVCVQTHSNLFHEGTLQLTTGPIPSPSGSRRLGEEFDVRQGIAENPPRISPRTDRQSGGRFRAGEGVFVLSRAEIDSLRLCAAERGLLRPYFTPQEIPRYHAPGPPVAWLLYLSHKTAPHIEAFPQIARHLARFHELLSARREVRSGRIAWWHLHWPREERLFVSPRILAVQMGRTPRFALAVEPTFVGFSTNLILPRVQSTLSLPVLVALLNSSLATAWFEAHAKKRGVHLEISGHLLRRFPLPERDTVREQSIARAVEALCHAPGDGTRRERSPIEYEIDRLVAEWYGLKTGGS